MKLKYISILLLLATVSCMEQEVTEINSVLTKPDIIIDTSGDVRVESATNKETFAYLKGQITKSGGLEVERGAAIDTIGGKTMQPGMSHPDSVLKYAMLIAPELSPGIGTFTVKAKLPAPLKKFYYRMYSRNFKGVSVSPVDSFISAPLLCELIKPTPSSVGRDTLRVRSVITAGTITEPIINRGFVYSKIGGVTLENGTAVIVDSNSDYNQFRTIIRGLEPNTNYRIKAFVRNRGGVGYSPEITVPTKP
jgi:hypothetical protein